LLKNINKVRCYCIPPDPEESSKNTLIKQKYDIPKKIIELMESQEKELKNISNQLTNEKKVIEKIHDNTNDIYNYIDKIDTLQKYTLWFTMIIFFFKH
jgi:uncharacterized coiled-coil protein SlyX